jgi:hypothetical protein
MGKAGDTCCGIYFVGVWEQELLRVFDICEDLSDSQWIAHSGRSELRRVAQANTDTWVRWKQLLSYVFSDPLLRTPKSRGEPTLGVHQSVVAESWDSEGALDFQH